MNAALFVDIDNLYRSIRKRYQRRLNYTDYIKYIEDKFGCTLPIKIAYGTQNPVDVKSFISFLKALGFTTRFDEEVDWNVSIAINAMAITDRVETIILGSNHKNLWPLLEALQGKGIRTFVFGCNIHPVLKNLSEYLEIDDALLIEEKLSNETDEATQ